MIVFHELDCCFVCIWKLRELMLTHWVDLSLCNFHTFLKYIFYSFLFCFVCHWCVIDSDIHIIQNGETRAAEMIAYLGDDQEAAALDALVTHYRNDNAAWVPPSGFCYNIPHVKLADVNSFYHLDQRNCTLEQVCFTFITLLPAYTHTHTHTHIDCRPASQSQSLLASCDQLYQIC